MKEEERVVLKKMQTGIVLDEIRNQLPSVFDQNDSRDIQVKKIWKNSYRWGYLFGEPDWGNDSKLWYQKSSEFLTKKGQDFGKWNWGKIWNWFLTVIAVLISGLTFYF